jgi:hypothetical protein
VVLKPAQVTLGLCMAGALPWSRGLVLFPAQLIGGIVAAALVSCMFPGDIARVNTTLSPDTSIAQGVFIEMFLTCELVLAVLMLAVEKSKDTFIAPIGIGLALFVAEIAGESVLILPYISLRLLKIQTGHITYHRTHRGLLHWRFAQPNAQLWSSCRINVIP